MKDKIKTLNAKHTFKEVSEMLGIPYWKVVDIAKKENITSYYNTQILNNETKVLQLKEKGLSYIEIASMLGLSDITTRNIYLKNNLKLDGPGSGAKHLRKVVTNPFLDISSPEVQYWLGMLAADGNLSTEGYSIRLSQSIEREEVMIEYAKFLGGNVTMFKVKSKGAIKESRLVVFANEDIYKFLNTLGFTNKKSHTLDIKFAITWPFVLGYFDGDGSAKYYKKSFSYKIKITCSNSIMIDKLARFFKEEKIKYSITSKDKIKYPEQRDINILSTSREALFNKMYKNNLFCVKSKRGVIEQSINENSVN